MIKEFIFSWYFVVIFIFLCFFVMFRQSISKFIENMRVRKLGDNLLIESGQSHIEDLAKENDKKIEKILNDLGIKDIDELNSFVKTIKDDLRNKDAVIEKQTEIINALLGMVEIYEFSYLNLYLVYNSKLALLWFYNQGPQRAATKDFFMLAFPLPPQISNPQIEKEAIFDALVSNNLLISTKSGAYAVSPKGEKFLRFIKLIP